jgi:hypothetical protein
VSRKGLSEGVLVACIAAVSALAGTLVGAIVTYEGNSQLQNRQVRQEEARQDTVTRAVARLLTSEYQADIGRLVFMIEAGEYDPESYRERTFVSHIGQEDRKLLAGRLTGADWNAISRASREIEAVEANLEVHHGKGEVGHYERATLEAADTACKSAVAALTPLTGRTAS